MYICKKINNMAKWSFDIARESLRKYLLENKEEVKKDLVEMRVKSTGECLCDNNNNPNKKYISGFCFKHHTDWT